MPSLIMGISAIKKGINGFYPWADKEKTQKNPYANKLGVLYRQSSAVSRPPSAVRRPPPSTKV